MSEPKPTYTPPRVTSDTVDFEQVAAAHLRLIGEQTLERDHLLAIIEQLTDGLSMYPPPAWGVWAANMRIDGWEFKRGRWHSGCVSISVYEAATFFLDGETPPTVTDE